MKKTVVSLKRLVNKSSDSNLSMFVEKTVTEVATRNHEEPRVKPLLTGCPIWLEEKYRRFAPCYRDGLNRFGTTLTAIRWSDDVRCYVALYVANFMFDTRHESFVWGWIGGEMVELEQIGVRGKDGREIDLRWLATVAV